MAVSFFESVKPKSSEELVKSHKPSLMEGLHKLALGKKEVSDEDLSQMSGGGNYHANATPECTSSSPEPVSKGYNH